MFEMICNHEILLRNIENVTRYLKFKIKIKKKTFDDHKVYLKRLNNTNFLSLFIKSKLVICKSKIPFFHTTLCVFLLLRI